MAGEADAVVLTRLKNSSVIHGLHEERVVLALEVARADVPGRAISAATFGLADEEVHARLRIELLPPQARCCMHCLNASRRAVQLICMVHLDVRCV